jgi:hypothetical protein
MTRLIQQAHELHLLEHGGSSRKDIASDSHVRPALFYVRVSEVGFDSQPEVGPQSFRDITPYVRTHRNECNPDFQVGVRTCETLTHRTGACTHILLQTFHR